MAIEFFDEVPQIVRTGGPNALPPEVQEFLNVLEQNPGRWAEFPIQRKTKPKLPEPFEVAGRGGKWYVSDPGTV